MIHFSTENIALIVCTPGFTWKMLAGCEIQRWNVSRDTVNTYSVYVYIYKKNVHARFGLQARVQNDASKPLSCS